MHSARDIGRKKLSAALLWGIAWTLSSGGSLAQTDLDGFRLAIEGSHLSAEEATRLEASLAERPDQFPARAQLLGYYFSHRAHADGQARKKHVLWVIENHPRANVVASPYAQFDAADDVGSYEEAKQLWLRQIEYHAQDPLVLGNAARFFTLQERERAEELFKRAQSLDPANPEWAQQLGHLYSLQASGDSAESRREAATRSLEQLETALALASPARRRAMLAQLAKVAFDASDWQGARSYAQELLQEADESSWNYGNAIHHGNLILGRLALRSGDIALAKLHLIEAGKTPGSPQLDSFGPNMTLAKELLETGERQAILDYFELCREFWSRHDRLDAWGRDIKAGRMPDFGANLRY